MPNPYVGTDEAAGKIYDSYLVRRLWAYIRPHQRYIWQGLALLLVVSGMRLAQPLLVRVAINRYLVPVVESAPDAAGAPDLNGFTLLALGLLVVIGVEFLVRRRQMYVVGLAGQNSLYDLRLAVFRHLQQLPARFFDRTPIGRLVGRVTTDIEALQELFASGVVTIFGDFVFLAATAGILFYFNVRLTLIGFTVVPVLLVITMFIRVRVRSSYGSMRMRIAQLNAYLHEHVSGMPVVQMFVREGLARDGFADINDGVRDAQLDTVRWESGLSAITEMLSSFTVALILWYGGGLAIDGYFGVSAAATAGAVGRSITLGDLFLFVDFMQKFFAPLNELSLKYTVMQNAMTSSERIFNLLDVEDRIPEPDVPVEVGEVRGGIELRNVTFGYDPNEPVLRDVSMRITPGERVAIVGATGAGKTTILKLLTRMYDIQAGEIRLDDVDIRAYPLRSLRRRIGVVPQDVFLFAGDILSNIKLGFAHVSDADAIAAADQLHLNEMVARFPGGYREPVRERGKNLSAGEKQLVAFARVLALAPKVLVLDEATSNVDTHTEHLLQEAVHLLMAGRTSLIIAHRLSTIKDVDRILVMHKGRLVEDGTHEELFARRGVYWRLYQLQYKEQEGSAEAGAGAPSGHAAS